MFKYLVVAVKNIVLAIFMLYGLNLLISSLNIIIPINIITIAVVTLLGIPGVLTLVVLFLLI